MTKGMRRVPATKDIPAFVVKMKEKFAELAFVTTAPNASRLNLPMEQKHTFATVRRHILLIPFTRENFVNIPVPNSAQVQMTPMEGSFVSTMASVLPKAIFHAFVPRGFRVHAVRFNWESTAWTIGNVSWNVSTEGHVTRG
jgi:hypothetical protein